MNKQKKTEKDSTEFTLIELLIVIAILAILCAMLLPALNAARDKGYAAKCMGNLKQQSVAFLQYTGDMEEWMPVSSSDATYGVHYYWRYAIAPYLGIKMDKEKVSDNNLKLCGKTPVFWCEKTIPDGEVRDWDVLSYGLAASDLWQVSGWGKNPDQRKRLNCIKGKSPSQTVVSADTSDAVELGSDIQSIAWEPTARDMRLEWVGNRHTNGVNLNWADGHVSWMSRSVLNYGKGDTRKYYWLTQY